ncbi:MAG: LacI family DNA-binding transcriptional regulator [Vulcanimicrobiaceae bacterium]
MSVGRSSGSGATIKDIAEKLGLSHTTVSRAINDHPHISEATKALVRQAADDLLYVPHSAARTVRRGHGHLVALVVPNVQTEFYNTVAKVLGQQARRAGYQLVLGLTEDDPHTELAHCQTLVEARAAGIIITPSAAPLKRTMELLGRTTCLQLNRYLPQLKCDGVGFDDAAGVRLATDHLLSLGHRRIGWIGAEIATSTGAGRLRGYLEPQRALGIEPDPSIIKLGAPRPAFGHHSMLELLQHPEPPTAIIMSSSELTAGGLEAVHAARVAVPDDVSLVGYTDPIWYRLIVPAMTTIALPVTQVAETTASILFSRIEGRADQSNAAHKPTPSRIVLTPECIVRDSTAPPRVRG